MTALTSSPLPGMTPRVPQHWPPFGVHDLALALLMSEGPHERECHRNYHLNPSMNPQLPIAVHLAPHHHTPHKYHITAHSNFVSILQNCFHKNCPPQRRTSPRQYGALRCPSQLQKTKGWAAAASSATTHALFQVMRARSCPGARSVSHFRPCLQSWRLHNPGPRPDQKFPRHR